MVCYKLSPDAEDIESLPDRSISLEKAEWRIGQYDLPAIEAAMQVARAVGGKVTALSAGPSKLDNSKGKKTILSRGPDELALVVADSLADADAHQTARVLAGALRKMGGYDLVLCGEGSSDLYAQQVGPQLGQLLGVATVNAVSKIEPGEGKVLVERTLEDEVEVLEVPLPAVLSVTTDIAEPRLPGMRDILAAGKKPVTVSNLGDVDLSEEPERSATIVSTQSPMQADRKRIHLEGESEDVAREFLALLRKEGVL